jgi:hypothetical protein
MIDKALFQPVAVLVVWTLLVLLLVPIRRFRAAAKQKVTANDFRFGESATVPPDVSIPNRAWMNLLEAPLLFYVGSIIWFSIGGADQTILNIAWAYVALRIVHTLIHVTYNQVLHRLIVFALSNIALVMFWVPLLIAVMTPPA